MMEKTSFPYITVNLVNQKCGEENLDLCRYTHIHLILHSVTDFRFFFTKKKIEFVEVKNFSTVILLNQWVVYIPTHIAPLFEFIYDL